MRFEWDRSPPAPPTYIKENMFQLQEHNREELARKANVAGSHDNPGRMIGAGLMHIGDALNNIARAIAYKADKEA